MLFPAVVLRCSLLLLACYSLDVAQSNGFPYTASSLTQTATGLTGTLTYQGSASSVTVSTLFLNVTYVSDDIVRIRMTDAQNARWEVPITLETVPGPTASMNYQVTYVESPFNLKVTRLGDGKVIFNLDPTQNFLYNNQQIVIMNNLGYPVYFYGLGERTSSFHLAPGVYTTFAKDNPGPYDSGNGGNNLYGHHPFYLAVDPSDGSAFGGFFLNSNDQDAYITTTNIEFETIGGVIDYFVFVGPTPLQVIQQYQSLLGTTVLIPYWGLGWHQCRYGYHSLQTLQEVANNYTSYVIPLDVMWSDIDYMDNYYDFTLDTSRYPQPQFSQWVDELHSIGRHFIPILDAGIAQQNYFGYNALLQMGCYITYPYSTNPFVGSVWPGNACFVDFFHPNSTQYWWNMLDTMRENVEFDGLWLDMNEASNFCWGECNATPVMNNFPYNPGNLNPNTKAIDMAAGHYGGIIEFDAHSLFGFTESRATSSYFAQHLQQRPFIIARSTFPTHGRYASKWLGDNFSGWDWMGYSIAGVFDMQMFGIPVVGADICGFMNDATEELCSRWTQLGTLYPFSRNHNDIDSVSQEPWALGPQYLQNSILAIRNRYSLLNYFYTLMFMSSLSPGNLIWQAAFFQYPDDSNLWDTHASDNFMIGEALIVHPCLQQGATSISAYFPQDIWYEWYFGAPLTLPPNQTVTLPAPAVGLINTHVRGGYIVPRLDMSSSANTALELRSSNTTLVIAPDASGKAQGTVIYDDGLNVNTISSGAYNTILYSYQQTLSSANFTISASTSGYTRPADEFPYISTLLIYACPSRVTAVENAQGALSVLLEFDPVHGKCMVFFDDLLPVDQAASLTINFS